MIIWICGLSGAGKTTIAKTFIERMKENGETWVLVDGDNIRDLLKIERSLENYTIEGRKQITYKIADFCSWLDNQDINVICSTISPLEDNKDRFKKYYEIFIDMPMDSLLNRDNKNLYNSGQPNIMGVDLEYEKPKNPNLTTDNLSPLSQTLDHIMVNINEWRLDNDV